MPPAKLVCLKKALERQAKLSWRGGPEIVRRIAGKAESRVEDTRPLPVLYDFCFFFGLPSSSAGMLSGSVKAY